MQSRASWCFFWIIRNLTFRRVCLQPRCARAGAGSQVQSRLGGKAATRTVRRIAWWRWMQASERRCNCARVKHQTNMNIFQNLMKCQQRASNLMTLSSHFVCVCLASSSSQSQLPSAADGGHAEVFQLVQSSSHGPRLLPRLPCRLPAGGDKRDKWGIPPDGSRKSQNMISSWVSNFMISIFPPGSEWFPVASVEGNYPRLGKPPRHAILNLQASVGYAKEFGSTGSQGTTGPRTTLSQPPSRARFLI